MADTSLRSPPESFDPEVVRQIDARLDRIEAEHDVRVLLAVEWIGRASAFPRAYSDYYCSFIYTHPPRATFSLAHPCNDIDTPLTPMLSVGGWELRKALDQLLRGNPVVVEWLASPVVYRGDPAFRDAFFALAQELADKGVMMSRYHYWAAYQYALRTPGCDTFSVKEFLRVLRPLLTWSWLATHEERLAPVGVERLMAGLDLAPDLSAAIHELIEREKAVEQMGQGTVAGSLLAFVEDTLKRATEATMRRSAAAAGTRRRLFASPGMARPDASAIARADDFYRHWLHHDGA